MDKNFTMKMKNTVSGKTYTITQIFRDDMGYFRVLYFDPETNSWQARSLDFFTPVEN